MINPRLQRLMRAVRPRDLPRFDNPARRNVRTDQMPGGNASISGNNGSGKRDVVQVAIRTYVSAPPVDESP